MITQPMSPTEIWRSVCQRLSTSVPESALDVWFLPAICSMPDSDQFEIRVPSLTTRTVLEHRYRDEIGEHVAQLVGHACPVEDFTNFCF